MAATEQVFSAPAAHDKKIELRNLVLEHLSPARVFEGFAGLGEMYLGAWSKAFSYTGCDIRPITIDVLQNEPGSQLRSFGASKATGAVRVDKR